MKRIIEDILSEHFTRKEWLRYAVLYPLAIIAACLLAGALE